MGLWYVKINSVNFNLHWWRRISQKHVKIKYLKNVFVATFSSTVKANHYQSSIRPTAKQESPQREFFKVHHYCGGSSGTMFLSPRGIATKGLRTTKSISS